ncbi:MAG: PD-(D/E)XK nuclease family protein [Anaerolineae bacterium]|nr:PD-(D/E)XK nuclease family protein [Anaerolineae bacterium]
MPLPSDFQFSQNSLQDYVDCPWLFYLRYVRGLSWPAVEAEPALEHEQHLEQGAEFHQLVHQQELGISSEQLSSVIRHPSLRQWWRNFQEKGPADVPGVHYPEIVLSAPLAGHRLMAKYDLLAVEPAARGIVLDWKTYHRRRSREWLARRLQTRVYPYLLVCAGSHLNDGQPFEPGMVEMIYWFANFPEQPERFAYHRERYEEDEAYLSALVEEIEALSDAQFELTDDKGHCRFCPYRSLCERGIRAADFLETEEDGEAEEPGIFLDFEQVAEIEY